MMKKAGILAQVFILFTACNTESGGTDNHKEKFTGSYTSSCSCDNAITSTVESIQHNYSFEIKEVVGNDTLLTFTNIHNSGDSTSLVISSENDFYGMDPYYCNGSINGNSLSIQYIVSQMPVVYLCTGTATKQ